MLHTNAHTFYNLLKIYIYILFFKTPVDRNANIQIHFFFLLNNSLKSDKDVIILTLFLLQDVTPFNFTGFDPAALLEDVFAEAAEDCLYVICVQKCI